MLYFERKNLDLVQLLQIKMVLKDLFFRINSLLVYLIPLLSWELKHSLDLNYQEVIKIIYSQKCYRFFSPKLQPIFFPGFFSLSLSPKLFVFLSVYTHLIFFIPLFPSFFFIFPSIRLQFFLSFFFLFLFLFPFHWPVVKSENHLIS